MEKPIQGLINLEGTKMEKIHSTTVLAVRRNNSVTMGADGQVTLGDMVMKKQAKKIRRLYHDKVIVGFAGSAADAFALFGKFEAKLEEFRGQLQRSAVELAKEWRTDKMLRHLEAQLIAVDVEHILLISGNGDVIEPDDQIISIGSGGPYALSAARALLNFTELSATEIVREAMQIASDICIYTNNEITLEELHG